MLPPPNTIWVQKGYRLKRWDKSAVEALEQSPKFKKQRKKMKSEVYLSVDQKAISSTIEFLQATWRSAPLNQENNDGREKDIVGILAGKYHEAILAFIPASGSQARLASSQISGYVGQFLSLERQCDSKTI